MNKKIRNLAITLGVLVVAFIAINISMMAITHDSGFRSWGFGTDNYNNDFFRGFDDDFHRGFDDYFHRGFHW